MGPPPWCMIVKSGHRLLRQASSTQAIGGTLCHDAASRATASFSGSRKWAAGSGSRAPHPPLRGALSPLTRGEGKKESADLTFPSPRSRGEGGRRPDEGNYSLLAIRYSLISLTRQLRPRLAELRRRAAQPVRQHPHDLDRHVREFGQETQELILADLERLEPLMCPHGGGARHVAQDRDLPDDGILLEIGDLALVAGPV